MAGWYLWGLTVLLTLLIEAESSTCPRTYYVAVQHTRSQSYGCGWWGRRCTRYSTYYTSQARSNSNYCCAGWYPYGSCEKRDGKWSSFGAWSACTATCESLLKPSTHTRSRSCTNPSPAGGGQQCPGASTQTVSCNKTPCPGNGNWGAWSNWGACSQTCDQGTRTRNHACDSPAPVHGGEDCIGEPSEEGFCSELACPGDGQWGVWSGWTDCSKPCGRGTLRREHQCDSPPPSGGKDCAGESSEENDCNTQLCPIHGLWGSWTAWTECSNTCGGGTWVRKHQCDNPLPSGGGKFCQGHESEYDACNTHECPGITAGAIAGIVIGTLLILAIIVILIVIFLWYLPRKKARKSRAYKVKPKPIIETYVNEDDDEDIYVYGNLETLDDAVWNTNHSNLTLGKTIANGSFAEIREAEYRGSNGMQIVAAKMIKSTRKGTEEEKLCMKAKMNFLAPLPKHENIVNCIAAIQSGPIILLDYCKEGTLKDWLKNLSVVTGEVTDQMIQFCIHICNGMEHLHDNGFLHRRLGARNVLLTRAANGELVAKVTGFGPMTSETNAGDKADKLPIKWMAPEQLSVGDGGKRIYTCATDVWSFGITAWEIFSLGERPYTDRPSATIAEYLQAGNRLEKPEHSHDLMYNEVMLPCWDDEPEGRPSFAELRAIIERLFLGTHACEGSYYSNNMYAKVGDEEKENMANGAGNKENMANGAGNKENMANGAGNNYGKAYPVAWKKNDAFNGKEKSPDDIEFY